MAAGYVHFLHLVQVAMGNHGRAPILMNRQLTWRDAVT
jgi:hypothetical protein